MTRLALLGCDDAYVSAVERIGEAATIVEEIDPGSIEQSLEGAVGEVDAIVVGPGCEARMALAGRAARAGKHVLVSLAFADPVEEVAELVEVCSGAGVTLMFGSRRLYSPAVHVVRQSLASGKLGSLGALRIHCWHPMEDAVRADAPPGELIEQIAVACRLFGSDPEAVYSLRRAHGGTDSISVHFGFRDGGMALVDVTLVQPDMQGYCSLTAIGSTGAAYADEHRDAHLVVGEGAPVALLLDQERATRINELGEFLAAVRDARWPTSAGEWVTAAMSVTKVVLDGIASGHSLRREGAGYERV